MGDYLDRMKQEKAELNERILKAENFLKNNELSKSKANLLGIQIIKMQEYSDTLAIRIKAEEEERVGVSND